MVRPCAGVFRSFFKLKDYKKNVRKQINGKFYSRMKFQVNTPRLAGEPDSLSMTVEL